MTLQMKTLHSAGGKPHVPPSPDPDRQGGLPPDDPLPGQDDDPRLAPLQERKERDALKHLREDGPQRESGKPG